MANNNNDLYKYFKEYYDRFFGGKELESAFDREYYQQQEQLLGQRRTKMRNRLMETLYAQGIQASGVGTGMMIEGVEKPIAEAEAGLDYDRMERQRQEKIRREGIAMGLAQQRLTKEEEERKRKGGFWGRLLGTAVGGIGGFLVGGPGGAIAGAGLGGSLFGGGGGGSPSNYNDLVGMYYNYIQNNPSPGRPSPLYNDPSMQGMLNYDQWWQRYGSQNILG